MKFHFAVRLALGLLLLHSAWAAVIAQPRRRDHLNAEEADRVREAQLIDLRTKVFIKAAERRFQALTDPNAANSKEAQKDLEKWGAFPKGTRGELLGDIAGILDEAINNIDNVAERDANEKLLPKALHALSAAAKRWEPTLESLRKEARTPDERDAIEEALEYIKSVTDAESQLPPEEKKKP